MNSGGVFAAAIARQTASGVSGISMAVMPSGLSASSTALTIAAGAAIAPASPQPRLALVELGSDERQIAGARQRVIHERP
jgi:hypothetical protein